MPLIIVCLSALSLLNLLKHCRSLMSNGRSSRLLRGFRRLGGSVFSTLACRDSTIESWIIGRRCLLLCLVPFHSGFLVFLPGDDQCSPGRIRRPASLGDFYRSKEFFQHLPPALASFSGFLVSLSTSRSALRGSLALTVTSDGIASPGSPEHSPPSARCREDFRGRENRELLFSISVTFLYRN